MRFAHSIVPPTTNTEGRLHVVGARHDDVASGCRPGCRVASRGLRVTPARVHSGCPDSSGSTHSDRHPNARGSRARRRRARAAGAKSTSGSLTRSNRFVKDTIHDRQGDLHKTASYRRSTSFRLATSPYTPVTFLPISATASVQHVLSAARNEYVVHAFFHEALCGSQAHACGRSRDHCGVIPTARSAPVWRASQLARTIAGHSERMWTLPRYLLSWLLTLIFGSDGFLTEVADQVKGYPE